MSAAADSSASAVRDMITAGHRARMIQVAAQLGLADLVAEHHPTIAELAALTKTDAESLGRLMRALAASDLFAQNREGIWSLTTYGEALRSDAQAACHAAALYWGLDSVRAAWDRLEHSLRTGSPSFFEANGRPFFEHMQSRRDDGQIFDELMTANQRERAAVHADAIDCRGIRTLVDVGGGEGAFLIEVVKRNVLLDGTLLELAPVAARARNKVVAERLGDRIAIVEGSFFDAVPKGADAYVLSAILHDWPDEPAVAILRACRAAMRPEATLLIVEQIVESAATATRFAAELDIAMLVLLGGRERTQEEFAALLASAGLSLCAATPTETTFSVILAKPV
jgi:hypothetical protein